MLEVHCIEIIGFQQKNLHFLLKNHLKTIFSYQNLHFNVKLTWLSSAAYGLHMLLPFDGKSSFFNRNSSFVTEYRDFSVGIIGVSYRAAAPHCRRSSVRRVTCLDPSDRPQLRLYKIHHSECKSVILKMEIHHFECKMHHFKYKPAAPPSPVEPPPVVPSPANMYETRRPPKL